MSTAIQPINLRGIDLNLLTVFDAIVTEGSLTRAAAKIGMSQPAASNALARFRAVTDDPLFVRTPQGLVPTVRARALAEQVRQALDLIQSGLQRTRAPDVFDQTKVTRLITIAVEDYVEIVIMPRFVGWLAQVAPGLRLRLRADLSNMHLSRKLKEGGIDLAIRYFDMRDADLEARHVLDEEFVSLVRQDHPSVGDSMGLEQYIELPHVVFGRLGRGALRNSIVDRELRRLGLSRRIVIQVPGFSSMPNIVRSTNFVCTLPRKMAHIYATDLGLKIVRTPLELAKLPLYLTWARSMERDPAHSWFRDSLYDLCRRS